MQLHDNLNDATRFTFYTEAVLAGLGREGFAFMVVPIPSRKWAIFCARHMTPTRFTVQFSDGKYA